MLEFCSKFLVHIILIFKGSNKKNYLYSDQANCNFLRLRGKRWWALSQCFPQNFTLNRNLVQINLKLFFLIFPNYFALSNRWLCLKAIPFVFNFSLDLIKLNKFSLQDFSHQEIFHSSPCYPSSSFGCLVMKSSSYLLQHHRLIAA